jgi:hypothetical protein
MQSFFGANFPIASHPNSTQGNCTVILSPHTNSFGVSDMGCATRHQLKLHLSNHTMSKSSYTAYNAVDDTVAKPVLGSDGAARWQTFRENNKAVDPNSSVAPLMPLKKLDRALGTQSLKDERANEAKIRSEAGDRALGEGYTEFKRKTDHEEHAARKRRKMILDRVRPDDAIYFIEAETFEGSKFDYVFTTRDHGTGYYWDGMDSLKKELGQTTDEGNTNNDNTNSDTAAAGTNADQKPEATKKKKKTKHHVNVVPEADPFNPMEQVAAAIARRNQALQAPPTFENDYSTRVSDAAALGANVLAFSMASSAGDALDPSLVAAGWESAQDPGTSKVYYFNRKTNERSWSKPTVDANDGASITASDAAMLGACVLAQQPAANDGDALNSELVALGWQSTTDPSSGKTYYFNRNTNETKWTKPIVSKQTDDKLPEGWKSAKDATTGKVYYYDNAGNTSWTRPEKA